MWVMLSSPASGLVGFASLVAMAASSGISPIVLSTCPVVVARSSALVIVAIVSCVALMCMRAVALGPLHPRLPGRSRLPAPLRFLLLRLLLRLLFLAPLPPRLLGRSRLPRPAPCLPSLSVVASLPRVLPRVGPTPLLRAAPPSSAFAPPALLLLPAFLARLFLLPLSRLFLSAGLFLFPFPAPLPLPALPLASSLLVLPALLPALLLLPSVPLFLALL